MATREWPGGDSVVAAERLLTGLDELIARLIGPDAEPDALTPASVCAYRDRLEASGRSPATIATHALARPASR